MQKMKITKRIYETGAMAIVRVETIERGFEIAEGCLKGGIDCLEISYTLPNAGEVIAALKKKYGNELVIGAGTVLDSETARAAILAGAQFVIAPNLSEDVAIVCNRYQVPYAPIPNMPILASGGITLDNLHEYVEKGVECCGFGGLLTKGTTEEISQNAKKIKTIINDSRAKIV